MRLVVLPMWMMLFGAGVGHADDKGLWIADDPQRTTQHLYDPCRDGRLCSNAASPYKRRWLMPEEGVRQILGRPSRGS
ncbi:hypothetical protein QM996_27060 (plasmid) [Sinorhizobium chiapasense]|uniref:hypothetical protein n=1 Tax=Sinorhizobium chiapasense TaxID=501572 RepID=UPI002FE0022E